MTTKRKPKYKPFQRHYDDNSALIEMWTTEKLKVEAQHTLDKGHYNAMCDELERRGVTLLKGFN